MARGTADVERSLGTGTEGGDSDSGSGFAMGVFGWSVILAWRSGKVKELVFS